MLCDDLEAIKCWYYCNFNQYTARKSKLSQGLDDTVRSISSPILQSRYLIIRLGQLKLFWSG